MGKTKKTKFKASGIIALLIIILIVFFAARFAYDNFMPNVLHESVVYIHPGTDYQMVLKQIDSVVANERSFNRMASKNNLRDEFKPGRYKFRTGSSNRHIIRNVSKGYETPLNLTLSGNIRNLPKLASILGRKLAPDSLAFINYFNDSLVWQKYGLTKETFETLFLPNTYEMFWTVTPEKFVERMKRENDKFWTAKRLKSAHEMNMTKEQVSTLASIICEESNFKKEYPRIAGVYINRLNKNMPLGADPTIKFILNDPSIKRIVWAHLQVESPYNTYKHTGLPPGPITIPSIAAIDAVLNYEHHDYLYFCADPSFNGMHKFAKTFREHGQNAKSYQKALGTSSK